ncbi:hypothetical protein DV515_00014080 [Chloebia gouldiae]|uniref:Uncharacterized protein n=1 Tax=Chloebia gouldiae TaxID=44316 RepID=A0A3L8S0J8_CHLGU|nr:hypothetical protein DV515_00014080 [Chloebia gouldiae]
MATSWTKAVLCPTRWLSSSGGCSPSPAEMNQLGKDPAGIFAPSLEALCGANLIVWQECGAVQSSSELCLPHGQPPVYIPVPTKLLSAPQQSSLKRQNSSKRLGSGAEMFGSRMLVSSKRCHPALKNSIDQEGSGFDEAHSKSQQMPAFSIIFEGLSLILIRFEIKQVPGITLSTQTITRKTCTFGADPPRTGSSGQDLLDFSSVEIPLAFPQLWTKLCSCQTELKNDLELLLAAEHPKSAHGWDLAEGKTPKEWFCPFCWMNPKGKGSNSTSYAHSGLCFLECCDSQPGKGGFPSCKSSAGNLQNLMELVRVEKERTQEVTARGIKEIPGSV